MVELLIRKIYIKLPEEALSRLFFKFFFHCKSCSCKFRVVFLFYILASEQHAEGDVNGDLACSQGKKALLWREHEEISFVFELRNAMVWCQFLLEGHYI